MRVIHIPAAFQKCHDPREQDVQAPMPSEYDLWRLDRVDAIERLAADLGGYARLKRWVENIAYAHGEEV